MSKTVSISNLKTNLFVRQALNEDHVQYMGELIESGVVLPPIKITRDNVVVDGRHRIAAHELNDKTMIEAEIVDVADESDLIASAYKSNVGGSLPPTRQDTEHTILLMIERDVSVKRIGEMLGLLPGMARKYVKEVQSKAARQRLMDAARAVTEGGLTVAQSAEKYGVDPEKLKDFLSGKRRSNKFGVAEVQRALTTRYRSLGQKNAALIKRLLEKREDGDMSDRQVRQVLAHIEQLQKKSARSIADWVSRFNAKVNGKNGAPASEKE